VVGAGLVGSLAALLLAAKGHHVTGVARSAPLKLNDLADARALVL